SGASNVRGRGERPPVASREPLDPIDFVRTIAVARITMPASVVRLSAGREDMSPETQALCFLAGANSIFYGPKLLTTPNPQPDRDQRLLDRLGMVAMPTRASGPAHAVEPGRQDMAEPHGQQAEDHRSHDIGARV